MSFLRELVAALSLVLAATSRPAVAGDINPVLVGSWPQPAPGLARAVAVVGDYAYLADGNLGLQIIDVRDPAHPVSVGAYDTSGFAEDVAVSGNSAYVADREAGLQVIDVSDPSHPQRVGGFNRAGRAWAVAVAGNHAYVTDDLGLQVMDISNPASPLPIGDAGRLGGVALDLALSGPNALVLVDPDVGRQDLGTNVNARRLTVSGNYFYVAARSGPMGGVQVFEVSTPAKPRRVVGNSTFDGRHLAVRGERIYLATYNDGLAIFEMPPLMKAITKEGPNVKLEWEGFGPARLQRATRLTNPEWQDLIGSENTNRVTLPMWSGPEFSRLVRP